MPLTFSPTIPPQSGPSGTKQFHTSQIRFGDGYSQTSGKGLNSAEQSWPLTWKGTDAEITPIRDFFDLHAGITSFYWTPPLGVQGRYIVRSYSLVPEAAGNASITAAFEQVFHP